MSDLKNKITHMFNQDSGNTWVFTGGENAQGGWHQTKGARNFIGHFEEHIRWEKRDDQYVGTRERYVINTAKRGQSIEAINNHYEELVSLYHPRAVALFIGREDYAKGKDGLDAFKENLSDLVGKIKKMGAVPILQTPVPAKDEEQNREAASYAQVMIQMAYRDTRILLVDHFNKCMEKGLSYFDGQLNPQGHLEIGKQFMEATSGDYTLFELKEVVDEAPRLGDLGEALEEDLNAMPIKALLEQDKEQPLRWVFLGDSITHGALHTHGYDSLPQLLEKFIRDEKGRVHDVFINTAVSGATTKDQLINHKARFEVYKEYADIVIIMFGTNDCISDVSLDDFRKNLRQIISDVKEAGAIPILRGPNPCFDAPSERGKRIIPYIHVIKECAKEEKLVLINHYENWMKVASEYLNIIKRGAWIAQKDEASIHPGEAGQLQMFHETVQRLGLWNPESEMARLAYKMKV